MRRVAIALASSLWWYVFSFSQKDFRMRDNLELKLNYGFAFALIKLQSSSRLS